MPVFVAALIGGLVSAAGSLIGRILIAMGVGIVAYSGIDVAITALKNDVISNILGQDAHIVQLLGALRIDQSVNILFSAYAARMVLKGLTGGTIKRMVLK